MFLTRNQLTILKTSYIMLPPYQQLYSTIYATILRMLLHKS
nr:MAG TPA: hypothetical protein [Caudoviricetes sp.]